MKRTAFTMIELIFVIVILGILASVAIPKLASVQDDALVSTEQAGIGAMRTSVTAIRGTAILRGANDFRVEVTTSIGRRAFVDMVQPTPLLGTSTLNVSRFPASLSLLPSLAVAIDGTAGIAVAATNDVDTLGLVFDAGDRDQWATGTPGAAVVAIEIVGPASRTLINGETEAELDNAGSWGYSTSNGAIVWRPANAYSDAGTL